MKLLSILTLVACVASAAAAGISQTEAAHDVLTRLVGPRASHFDLKQIPKENGKDVLVLEARDGKLSVSGSSGVAICRGAYHYIRENGLGMVAWTGRRLDLPEQLPDFPTTKVVSPYPLRLYYNACAFAYTTAFWQWPEWERELDWMAVHGINLPLASVATEAIWERVWKKMGLTQAELDDYFIGPGFLPFQRMNCINKHGGPLTATWQRQSVALQHKILDRMRALGMEPLGTRVHGRSAARPQKGAIRRGLASIAGMGRDATRPGGVYSGAYVSPLQGDRQQLHH